MEAAFYQQLEAVFGFDQEDDQLTADLYLEAAILQLEAAFSAFGCLQLEADFECQLKAEFARQLEADFFQVDFLRPFSEADFFQVVYPDLEVDFESVELGQVAVAVGTAAAVVDFEI